ncbi:Holliday junction branch migration protein RuvA [Deferrisoma camini]|uniref:Holliday junction branch migration protein RuvA n=1 Tax=Deferrisoma camini TaxID=1035120 RepID=UPI00046CC8A8|nr:Holliday junction branch migration protein RuvA [Deferrisoma camini]
MIARLAGKVELVAPGEVVVETGGVGYRVWVPLGTYQALSRRPEGCRLRVVTLIRDEEIHLYGFRTAEEEELFRALQGVTGVGPKLALRILSGLVAADLRSALARADHAALTAIPGVGKKLAQRLVLELKDKMVPSEPIPAGASPAGRPDPSSEAAAALEALGYPARTASDAVRRARDEGAEGVEETVKAALRMLAARR